MMTLLKHSISERIYWLIYIETPISMSTIKRNSQSFYGLSDRQCNIHTLILYVIYVFYIVVVLDFQG